MTVTNDTEPAQSNSAEVDPAESNRNELNLMEAHFNDERRNHYSEGPGADLGNEFSPGALARRSADDNKLACSLYLKKIPKNLTKEGLENFCQKFGKVVTVWKFESYNTATVTYATVGDAQNAITNINGLRREVNGRWTGIQASFKTKKAPINEEYVDFDLPTFLPEEENTNFDFPFATPVNLDSYEEKPLLTEKDCDIDMLREFINQQPHIILENDQVLQGIKNGRESYSHSPNEIKTLEQLGSFDADKQELVYNGGPFSETGECKNCGVATLTFCKKCKDFFCSSNCIKECNRTKSGCSCITPDKTDRKTKSPKRNSLGRGGRLLALSRSLSSTDSDTEETKSHSVSKERTIEPCELPLNNKLVVITCVISHTIVFLRSIETKANERYLKYLNDVAECSKTAPSLKKMPKKGDIVLADFDGVYYRALVARILSDDVVVVAFLEFGNLETVAVNTLKELRDDLKYVKRFTFKANLSDVNESLKSDKCVNYLHLLLKKKIPLKFISKDEVSLPGGCQLFLSTTNDSVSAKVKALNTLVVDWCMPVKESHIPGQLLDINSTNTKVVVIDNTLVNNGFISVARPEHLKEMLLMHQRIQEYCQCLSNDPHMALQDEICLAKCNGQWYRAKLARSYGDRNPVMLFIDFLIYNKVHVDNMRPMPVEFKFPRYAVFVEIGDITDATNLAEQFQLLTEITVKRVEEPQPDEQTIFVDLIGGCGAAAPIKKRQKLLDMLKKSLKSGA